MSKKALPVNSEQGFSVSEPTMYTSILADMAECAEAWAELLMALAQYWRAA
ncbi:hypothetical protein [Pararobbsia alpina]|uniref:hypothetical protein n=1 Tax=Pararobbsia alpina TaxID=621374 RepID=UPI0015838AA0|nr:hypothetical protein [Pararobbsia alpina]